MYEKNEFNMKWPSLIAKNALVKKTSLVGLAPGKQDLLRRRDNMIV